MENEIGKEIKIGGDTWIIEGRHSNGTLNLLIEGEGVYCRRTLTGEQIVKINLLWNSLKNNS